MKDEMNIEENALTDNQLEAVSGGSGIVSKRDLYDCFYCKKEHVLVRSYPRKIRPAGSSKWYDNATKYECSTNGAFYTLPLEDGGIAYFNSLAQRLE